MQTTLLISLFFCHFLADYTHLSTNWMLTAKRIGSPWFPIFTHALIHAQLMWFVLWLYDIDAVTIGMLYVFQLCTHFLIDTLKGKMNVWFTSLQNPANKWHWIVFGGDQFLHALVIILMVHFCS